MHEMDFTSEALAVAQHPVQQDQGMGALVGITQSILDTVPGADCASVTVRFLDGRCETRAGTDPVTVRADDIQYVFEEGPCFNVSSDRTSLHSPDLRHDRRWPQYGRRVAALGLKSLLSAEVFDNGLSRGVLNVYSHQTGMLAEQRVLANRFATMAAAALGLADSAESFNDVLATSTLIGQAVGVAMGRHGLDEDTALQFLTRLSQLNGRKLMDVATELVSDGNQLQAS